MKRMFYAVGLCLGTLIAACGGDDDASVSAKPTPPPASASPIASTQPGVARGTLGAGAVLRSTDGKLEVKAAAPLDVTLKATETAGPPKGWTFVAPVYDISAMEGGRQVTALSSPLELSLKVPAGPATVMYYDGKDWVILDSESDGKGAITAKTNHLSAFTAARPAAGTVTRISATATATSSVPTPVKPTPTPIASKPAGTATPEPSPSPSPSATAKPSAAAGDSAATLSAPVARFKGKSAPITAAAPYAGTGTILLPGIIETAIASVAAQGELFYGLYSAVNEALTSGSTGAGAAGSFSLMVEPRTSFPSNTTDAQASLAAIFPGATGLKYAPSVSNASAYTFYANSGFAIYVMGYINYQGLPVAFLTVGTGAYYGLAFGTGTLQ